MKTMIDPSRLILSLVLLISASCVEAQSPATDSNGDTIPVHISATHYRECAIPGPYSWCRGGLYVDAIVNGKKVELFGEADKDRALQFSPGDYRAILARKPRANGKEVLFQNYFILLPNQTEWSCQITGLAE